MANEQIVGKLRAILGMDTAQYEAGVRKALQSNTQLQKDFTKTRDVMLTFKTALAGFGVTLGVGMVINFAREIGNFAGEMIDLSAETGITTTRLQAFNVMAKEVGLTAKDVTGAITQLLRRLAGGDESAEAAIERLGFTVGEFISMNPDEAFIKLGEAVAKVESPAERVNIMFELMGRTGPRMLRLITEDFGKLVEEIEKTGPIIKEEFLTQADRFDEAWSRAIDHVKAGIVNIFGTLAAGVAGMPSVFKGALSDDGAQVAGRAGDIALTPSKAGLVFGTGLPERGKADDALARRKKAADALIDAQNELARIQNESDASQRAAILERLRFLDFLGERRLDDIAEAATAEMLAEQEATAAMLARIAREKAETLEMFDFLGLRRMEQAEEDFKNQEKINKERKEQEARQQAELLNMWTQYADDVTFAITNGLADMLVGLRSFKDGFIGIWVDIRRAISNILSQMLAEFIGGYVRNMVAAMTGRSVAGTAVAGAAGVGGAAGGGAGLLALASNPFTIAAAAGIGLGVAVSKGFLRGGEEGTKVNPRRDMFIGQFGGWNPLQAQLRSTQLMSALGAADTVGEFEGAQAAIVSRFLMMGKPVKSFNMGGFIPPGAVQPAILHGGSRGEVVMPLDRMGARSVNNYFTIQGWDGQDILRVVQTQVIPILNKSSHQNTGGYATEHRRGFGIR